MLMFMQASAIGSDNDLVLAGRQANFWTNGG